MVNNFIGLIITHEIVTAHLFQANYAFYLHVLNLLNYLKSTLVSYNLNCFSSLVV